MGSSTVATRKNLLARRALTPLIATKVESTTCRTAHLRPLPSLPRSCTTVSPPRSLRTPRPVLGARSTAAVTISAPLRWKSLRPAPTSSPCAGCPPITEPWGCKVQHWKRVIPQPNHRILEAKEK
uniref:Uncharacterized protein n=1 Tax=Zea mays TaxID=4577 RepID=C0PK61_MAIZE|nr:unknown [Zea mays]